MEVTLCQKCFHYKACMAIDVSGVVNNPYPEPENESCEHFIDANRVKIQDQAKWLKKIMHFSDGDVHITYRCSKCNDLSKVRCYEQKEWDEYYSDHHSDDNVNLPGFCKHCGSVISGITPVDD